MKELILIGVFIAATILGYIIIKKVPSLLHTPLMSGMNALSGVTVLGALIVAATTENSLIKVLACAAVALAMINVAGGFAVTAKMLNMFKKRKHTGGEEA
jgi:NAD/NADP transhydrogenase alpha subunit